MKEEEEEERPSVQVRDRSARSRRRHLYRILIKRRIVAKKLCAGVKIVTTGRFVNCFATILTPAQTFLAPIWPLIEILPSLVFYT